MYTTSPRRLFLLPPVLAALALALVFCLSRTDSAIALPSTGVPTVELTQAERNYAESHEMTLVYDPAWPPFDYCDAAGKHAGIAADMLALICERTGLKLRPVKTKDWPETMELVRKGQFDIVSLLYKTDARTELLDFTEPILTEPLVFVTKGPHDSNLTLDTLKEPIAVVDGYVTAELLHRTHPEKTLLTVPNTDEGLRAVHEGRANVMLTTSIEARHLIRKNEWDDLDVVEESLHVNEIGFGIHQRDPVLRSIMRKGIESVTQTERAAILSKWLGSEGAPESNGRYWGLLPLAFAALAVSLFALRKGHVFK